MATQWYAAIEGEQKGPLALAELQGWAWQGRIDHETFVRQGPAGEWLPAGTVAVLFPDGRNPTPDGQAAAPGSYPGKFPLEWDNRRFAAISAVLVSLCVVGGFILCLVVAALAYSSTGIAMSTLAGILIWTVPGGTLGAIVGYFRRAGGAGAMLGGFFGPLGVVAALALDNRPYCTRCSGRLDDAAEICPHCRAALYDPASEVEQEPPDEGCGELRTWTDSQGKYTMRGRLVRQLGDVVTLRYEDGSEVDVPLESLGEQDRQWVRRAAADQPPSGGAVEAILIEE